MAVLTLCLLGPSTGAAQKTPKKKLSLAELAALEWKLEQAQKTVTTDPDAEARKKALDLLLELMDPRAAVPLAMALKEDPDPAVRTKAAQALAAFRSPEALGLLELASAADPDPGVRAEAAALLKKFPKKMKAAALPLSARPFKDPKEKVTPTLIKSVLASPSGDARLWAIKAMGTEKFPERDALLATHLGKDPSGRVRVEAGRLLAILKNKDALPDLTKAAEDGDPGVRFEIARILAEFDDSGSLSVLQKLAASDPNETVRAEAKDLLEPSTPAGKRLLADRIKMLRSENPAERIQALDGLASFTHWRAMVPMSCALLGDKSVLVRTAAAKTLPDMHDVSVQIALRVSAAIEEDKKLQGTVRTVVTGLRKKVDDLVAQLKSPEDKTRMLAVRALGQGAYPPGLDALIEALKDKDPKVRLAAAEGLQNFGEPKALDALKVAAADQDPRVRKEAETYFQEQKRLEDYRKIYKDPNRIVTWTMDKNAVKRADAAIALGVAGAERAEGNLARMLLHDADEEVRLAAAWSLVLMASERAEAALKKAAESDKSERVKLTARKFLVIQKVGREDLIAQLTDENPAVRQDAAEALSLMANSQVLNPLIKAALCDAEPKVRASSLRGLARIRNDLARMVIKVLMTRDPDARVRRAAMVMHIMAGG